MTYIGIDNGISGATAIICDYGDLLAWQPTPIQRARKGNEIDVLALWQWITETTGEKATSAVYALEEPGGSKSAKAAASMAASFGALRALLTIKRVKWHRTTPQAWQREMLPGCATGETKARALEAARRLWPTETWLRTERCSTPHDGAIDAALMAEWARRKAL